MGTMQKRLARPLRRDDALKSRSELNQVAPSTLSSKPYKPNLGGEKRGFKQKTKSLKNSNTKSSEPKGKNPCRRSHLDNEASLQLCSEKGKTLNP